MVFLSRNQKPQNFRVSCSLIKNDLSSSPPPASQSPQTPTQQRETAPTISSAATPKRKKIKRDPNQPKRPLTPFFFFCAENRNAVKEKDPSRSVGDIAKVRWGWNERRLCLPCLVIWRITHTYSGFVETPDSHISASTHIITKHLF